MADHQDAELRLHAELRALRARVAELEANVAAHSGLEAALHESISRFRGAFDYAAIGMALVAPDGRWLEVNQSLCDLVGYTAAELRATTFQAITHPDDLDIDLAYVQQMLTGSIRTYQLEKRYIHKQGHVLWILLSVSLVRDAANRPIYFISQIQDITAQKQAEAALSESEAQYRLLMTYSLDAVFLTVPTGQILAANPAATQMFGYTEAELCEGGRNLIVDADDPQLAVALAERARTGVFRGELNFRRRDGTIFPGEISSALFHDRNGQLRTSMVIRDVSARKQAERALRESEVERESLIARQHEMLRRTDALYVVAAMINSSHELGAVLRAVVDGAASVLPAHRTVLITIDMAAQRVTQQLEGGPGAIHAAPLTFVELNEGLGGVVLREGQPVQSLNGAIDPRESERVRQRRVRDQAGSILVVPIQSQGNMLGTLTAINAPDGIDFTSSDMELLVALANQAAIAIERMALLRELEHNATIDSLTQLLNRRAWLEQGQRIVAAARRSDRPMSVILLDADHFKRINDNYGHDAGDQVLQTISACCRQQVRASDIVGRYGGEEFVVLLPETNAPTALIVAERIRNLIASQHIPLEAGVLTITISLGIATMRGAECDLSTMLTQADRALYAAKRAGRNTVRSIDI